MEIQAELSEIKAVKLIESQIVKTKMTTNLVMDERHAVEIQVIRALVSQPITGEQTAVAILIQIEMEENLTEIEKNGNLLVVCAVFLMTMNLMYFHLELVG